MIKIDFKQKSIHVNFHKIWYLRSYIYVSFSAQWEKLYCILLTTDFCENVQEYFFVQNQLLIRKNGKKFKLLKNKCSLHAHLFYRS